MKCFSFILDAEFFFLSILQLFTYIFVSLPERLNSNEVKGKEEEEREKRREGGEKGRERELTFFLCYLLYSLLLIYLSVKLIQEE